MPMSVVLMFRVRPELRDICKESGMARCEHQLRGSGPNDVRAASAVQKDGVRLCRDPGKISESSHTLHACVVGQRGSRRGHDQRAISAGHKRDTRRDAIKRW